MKFLTIAVVAMATLAGASAFAQQQIEIRVGAGSSTNSVPIFAAVERGVFSKHGIDAKIRLESTGIELINGLLGGSSDIAILGSTPFLAGVSMGMPLVLIGHLHGDATKDYYSESNSIVASAASGIKEGDIAALKGKKIGLPRRSGAETHLRGLMTEAGLSFNDATIVNLRPSDIPTALRNGDVEVVSAFEPWASTTIQKAPGSVRVMWGNCKTCYDPGAILTTQALVAQKSDVLQKFMAAFADAQQWVRQNPDEAAKITMRWVQGIDLETMKESLRFSIRDSRLSKNTIDGYNKRAIPALVSDGLLSTSFDVAPAVDPKFYNNVQKSNPEYYSDLPPIPANRQFH